jgi:PAS domain S-box-containing protein
LHVDDDPSVREISKLMLMDLESNFDIDNACCVDEAFKKLSTGHYDIIISDYEMPLKNGLDFLKELRDQKNDVSFIIFTGRGREDVAVKALNLGADRYLNKNGSPETVYCELADAINKTIERKKSRELLAKSESKYHALVENSLQGISILQAAPIRLVFANSAFGKILGYSSEELMSLSPEEIMSLVYHEDRAVFFKRMENRLRGEPADSCFEFRAVRKDGSPIWLSSLANRVDYDGQPAVQGMFLDVTESKKAGEILRESEQRYRELANCLPDIVFEIDLNGHVEFANGRAAEISGYSLDEIERGLNIFQFIVPEDRERATKNIQRLLAGGSYEPAEYTFVRKDGTTFPALITATPRVCKNKVTGFRGIVLDISERKKAELELKQYNEILERVGEGIDAGLAVINRDYRVIWANKRLRDLGITSNKKCYETHNTLGIVCPDCGVEKIFEQNVSLDVHEYKTVSAQGETIWVELRVTPLKDKNGQVIAALELAVPITERKKAEQELQAKESKYRDIFNNSEVGMFRTRLDGSETFDFNDKYLSILGLTREEIKSRLSVSFWADPLERQEMVRLLKANGQVKDFECKLLNKRHEIIQCLTSVKLYTEQDILEGSILDITEHKKMAESLERDQQELNRIIDSSPIIIFYKDKEGKFIRVNQAFAQALEIPKEKFLGKTVFDFYSTDIARSMTSDDLEVLKSGHPKLGIIEQYESATGTRWVQTDKVPTFDKKGVVTGLVGFAQDITERKNFEQRSTAEHALVHEVINSTSALIFSVDRSYCYTSFNRAHALVMKTIFGVDIQIGKNIMDYMTAEIDREKAKQNIDKALAGEHVIEESYSGDEKLSQKYFIIIHSPIRNANGEVSGVVVVSNDITDHKKAEEELTKNQVRMKIMNEKLNVIGRLTRHDVGNKFMVMKSNIYLLKKQIGDNPKLAKYLEGIDFAINQSEELFEFSRFYEKIGVEAPSDIDVAQCFNQAVAFLPNLGSIKIVNDCQGLTVTADSLLKQLFYNLLDNSLEHGEKVTQIRLHFTKEKDGVRLFYEDNGAGIPEAYKLKLFHEGFTTGKSTGLGLFLIKKMVEVYGWTIAEEGEYGKGAKFVITIPANLVTILEKKKA